MQKGLAGRRIALVATTQNVMDRASVISRALENAGARVNLLEADQGKAEEWHAGRYAALVAVGDGSSSPSEPRLVQLTREFLVSDKPVAAIGSALSMLMEAGAVAGRTVAVDQAASAAVESAGGRAATEPIHADDALVTARSGADMEKVASRVVAVFADRLEEHDVDEMSEQSFPASDAPAVSPGSAPPAPRDRTGEPDSRA